MKLCNRPCAERLEYWSRRLEEARDGVSRWQAASFLQLPLRSYVVMLLCREKLCWGGMEENFISFSHNYTGSCLDLASHLLWLSIKSWELSLSACGSIIMLRLKMQLFFYLLLLYFLWMYYLNEASKARECCSRKTAERHSCVAVMCGSWWGVVCQDSRTIDFYSDGFHRQTNTKTVTVSETKTFLWYYYYYCCLFYYFYVFRLYTLEK